MDAIEGTDSAQAAPQATESPAPAVESAPAPAVEVAATPAAPAGADWDRIEQTLVARDRQWQEHLEAQGKKHQEGLSHLQETLRTAFDPEYAKQKNQPKYMTVEDFQREQMRTRREIYQQMATHREAAEFRTGLAVAKEKYPRVFSAYRNADKLVTQLWVQSAQNEGESMTPMEIAAELDAGINAAFTSKQAELVADKGVMGEAIKGGAIKPGGPAGAKDSGLRGFARLRSKFS